MSASAIARFGKGPLPVLALHCGLASGAAWAGIGHELSEAATLIAPDLPGHGQAPDWSGPGEYQADCVAAGLAALRGTGAAHVVGHSFGACVALRLAVEHPDKVLSLTLYEPVFFAAAAGTPEHAQNDRDFAPFVAAMTAGEPEAAARAFTSVWGGRTSWADLPEAQRRYMTQRIHLIRETDKSLHGDPAGLLKPGGIDSIGAPVLLLRGKDSPAITRVINARLAAMMPNAECQELDNARHMAPITQPKRVVPLIARHLESVA